MGVAALERIRILAGLMLALTVASGPLRGQSILYITDGDAHTLQAINTSTGAITFSNTSTIFWAYPIAVRTSVLLGYREYPGVTGEYNSADGSLIGTAATPTTVSPNWSQALDGATSLTNNYTFAWGGSNTPVYRTDTNWTNATLLFTLPLAGIYGIAYNTQSGNLWFSNSSTLYEYTTGGTLVSQFAQSGGNGGLAYQASTNTLWFVPNNTSSPLLQYSTSGTLLQSLSVAGRSSNVWGAEFQVVPEPSTWTALAGLGALVFVTLRKRRERPHRW